MEKHGKVLYEKDSYKKAYPASLTKVLTAIVVVENCEMTDIVTYNESALEGIQSGYITSGLAIGEEVTVEQLLHLFLICSYNDIGNLFAEYVAGSNESFAELMNAKAQEIGCQNSNFVNSYGLHDENHYTTAYDMALISRYAMQYEELREIVAKTYFELESTNKYAETDRVYGTTNSLLTLSNEEFYYKYAKGIKTGFTTPAGRSLSSYAIKDDLELYAVVLHCETTSDRYLSTINLFEYGFSEYEVKQVATRGENIQTIDIKNATSKTKKLNAVLETDIKAIVSKQSDYTIEPQVRLNDDLKAPIQGGTIIGTVTYEIEGVKYESNLLAGNDVEKTYMPIFFMFLFIILIIVFGATKIINNHKRKTRMDKIKHL